MFKLLFMLPFLLLSAPRVQTCATSACAGGIASALYLADKDNVASWITSGVGKVTAITMVPTMVFYAFDSKDFSGIFTEDVAVTDGCTTVVTQKFKAVWSCRNHADRNSIQELANSSCCGMIAIHAENTGLAWIWGLGDKKRVRLDTTASTSGAKIEDPNQTEVNFICTTTIDWMAAEFTPGVAGIPV